MVRTSGRSFRLKLSQNLRGSLIFPVQTVEDPLESADGGVIGYVSSGWVDSCRAFSGSSG